MTVGKFDRHFWVSTVIGGVPQTAAEQLKIPVKPRQMSHQRGLLQPIAKNANSPILINWAKIRSLEINGAFFALKNAIVKNQWDSFSQSGPIGEFKEVFELMKP